MTRPAAASITAPTADGGRASGGSRTPLLVLAGITVVTTLAAVAGWLRTPRPMDAPTVRMALDADTLNPDLGEFIVSPDGTKLALVGDGGVYLRTSDDPEFRLVRGTEDARDPTFSPDGEWIAFSRSFTSLQKVSAEGGSPLTLASPDGGVYMPHWGTDGAIVFANPNGIFLVSETGGEPEAVEGPVGRYPRLLPGRTGLLFTTGQRGVAFASLDGNTTRTLVEEGVHPIYVPETGQILYGHPAGGLFAVPFDPERGEVTGAIRPVLDEVAVGAFEAGFDVSDNGTLLYRRGVGGGGDVGELLVLIELDGTVDTLPLTPRDFDNPRFSPDGQSLAFEADDEVYTYDLELGTTTQLTFDQGGHRPVWSPDGSQVAYAFRKEGATDDVLMVKAVDGATPGREILDAPGDEHPVDWPSEDLLVFEQAQEGDVDLMLVDPTADTAEPWPYLQAEWDERDLSVSPDGTLASYFSDETGTDQLYVRRFPEPRGQWRISEGMGTFARWSADGDVLYYWSSPGAADTLIAARVRTDGPVVVESREPIIVGEFDFSDSDYDPVSGRFVTVQNVGIAGPQEARGLWLVVNWFTELRERLGPGT
jgi:Tol biopolymer transport system component